ncbi:hypothetical protein JZ751_026817 [Albula glossodonta]|uniref:Uncharacterized protein n=1 Tax=Albula glossodonta TaxID=121402 RepID=A0A8T2PD23_9TELE|nr:hypothetical protein JZ751_026817 [Albula glossodonta]
MPLAEGMTCNVTWNPWEPNVEAPANLYDSLAIECLSAVETVARLHPTTFDLYPSPYPLPSIQSAAVLPRAAGAAEPRLNPEPGEEQAPSGLANQYYCASAQPEHFHFQFQGTLIDTVDDGVGVRAGVI